VGVRGGLSLALLSWQQIKNHRSAFKLDKNLQSSQALWAELNWSASEAPRSPCSLLAWYAFRNAANFSFQLLHGGVRRGQLGWVFAVKPCSLPGGHTKIHRTLTAKSMSCIAQPIALADHTLARLVRYSLIVHTHTVLNSTAHLSMSIAPAK